MERVWKNTLDSQLRVDLFGYVKGVDIYTSMAYNIGMAKVFIETQYFTRLINELLSDDAQKTMMSELIENPEKGQLIQGTGGCRKLRVADAKRNKGKRGGIRVIYYYTMQDKIYFLDAFGKNEASDLSPKQKTILKAVVKELK